MNRRTAIRNSLMALAVSLVPKILQPTNGDMEEDIYDGERLSPYVHDERGQWAMYESDKSYVLGRFHYDGQRKVVFKATQRYIINRNYSFDNQS